MGVVMSLENTFDFARLTFPAILLGKAPPNCAKIDVSVTWKRSSCLHHVGYAQDNTVKSQTLLNGGFFITFRMSKSAWNGKRCNFRLSNQCFFGMEFDLFPHLRQTPPWSKTRDTLRGLVGLYIRHKSMAPGRPGHSQQQYNNTSSNTRKDLCPQPVGNQIQTAAQ